MEKRALVVDRDFFFVEFMAELLVGRGYEVIKAYNGKEGMQALDTHQFAFMFVDMVMPKVDGWQLILYARQKFPKHPFPIIAISGTILEQLDELENIGADYYIAKGPLDKMKILLSDFMASKENQPFPDEQDQRVFDMGNLYPRRESMALIESLHFQRAVTENIGIGILLVDTDGRILRTNPRALDILGKTEVEVLNRSVPRLFPGEDKNRVIRELKRIAKDPELGRNAFSVSLNNQRVHLVVSLLSYEKKAEGWIIAIVETDEWEHEIDF
jgi:PAS domain S-box-containing protein